MNKIYSLRSFLLCSFTFILFANLLHAQSSHNNIPSYNYSFSNFNVLLASKSFFSGKELLLISIKKVNKVSIKEPNTTFACPTITDSITMRRNVTCVSGNNGAFQFEGKGGVAPYTFTLSTISGDVTNTTGLFENLVAKDYRITITDANGCSGTSIRRIESFTDLNTLNNSMLSSDWLADSIASSASNTYTYLTSALPALKVNDDSLAQYGAGNLNAVSKYIPIGFSFKMDNFYYDSLVIAEDGVISFNKNINTSNYSLNQWYQNIFYTGLNTYSSPITGESCQCDTAYLDNALPFIAPLRDDIQANASGAVPSQIVYKLSGTAPNRVFTVEWRNMRWNRVCNVQRDNSVSFQVELFEGSNNVKFHYKAEPNLKLNNCGGDFMGDFSTVVGYDYSAGLFGRRLGGGNYIALNPDSTKLFTNSPNVVTDAGGTTLYRGVKTDNRNFPSAIGYPYGKHYQFISPATGSCIDPLSIVSVQATPSSGSNGMITITATGGLRKSDRYFYSKDGGKTYRQGSIPAAGTIYRDTFQGLAPGTYRIAVMDNQIFQISESGTPISQSFIIQTVDIPALKIDSIIDKDISCNGLNDGKLTFKWTKTSPTGTYNIRFEKSDGTGVQTFTGITDTIKQFTGLNANTYKITVTFNDYGSSVTVTETLTNPSNLTFTSAPTTAPTCFGGSNGGIVISLAGGTPPYMYSNNNGSSFQASETFTGLISGSYILKAKDSNGCLAVTSPTVSVANGTQVTIFSLAKNNADCKGTSTGDIFIKPDIGTRPFSYSSDNGATFQVDSFFKNIPAAVYPLKIKDANGCLSTTTNLTIDEPANFVTFSTSNTDISCANTTASITVTASGGTGVFQFSSNNGTNFTNSASTPNPYTFTSLTAGTYKIKVRDANGCLAGPTDVVLNGTTAPSITLNSKTDVRCNGSQTGVFNITVSGGALPYSVVVKNSLNAVIPGTGSNPYNYPDLAADTYTITVTDGNSCVATKTVNITQPSLFYATVSSTDVSCNGGTNGVITLTANGGVSPYQFSKDNGTTYVSTMTSSNTFTGLPAGTYLLKVKDANNCIGSTGRTITEPSALSVSINAQTNVSCHGASTGAVTLLASGGNNSSYTYKKDASTSNTTGIFTGLAMGTYVFTVTDGNNCETTKSVAITEPTALNVSINSQTNVLCHGASTGAVTLLASGGNNSTYTYKKDASTSNTTGIFTGLAMGTYVFTVTDGNNCEVTKSVAITEPTALSVSINSQTNVLCHGASTGAVTLLASGGNNSTYTYKKDASTSNTTGIFTGLAMGTYVFTVTDGNNCETTKSVTISEPSAISVSINAQTNVLCHGASTGAVTLLASGGNNSTYTYKKDASTSNTTGIFMGLAMGTYVFTVTDGNNCETTKSVTISEPSALNVSINAQTNVLCHGASTGAVTLLASGGNNSTYTYKKDASTSNTTGIFTGLAMGTYVFTVTDGNNCETTKSVSITEPTPLSIGTVNTTAATCTTGGTVTVTGTSGGNGAYTFKLTALLSNTTGTFTNIAGGNYTLTVTDGNGCEKTTSVNVANSAAPKVNVTAPSPILCQGGLTGTFSFSILGGTGSYTVLVKDGLNNTISTTGSNPYTVSGIGAGTYSISVTDGASCSASESVTITEPTALSISINSQTNVLCHGASTGAVTLLASGGNNSTYTYKKDASTSNTTGIFTGLAMGTYVFTVTDGNNCETTKSVIITEPSALSVSINSQTNVLCHGASTGAVTLLASGGNNSTYTYKKDASTSNTTGIFTGLAMGTYVFTVTDGNNCETTKSVTITEPSALSVSINSQTNVLCHGASTGAVTLLASGGNNSTYTYKKDASTSNTTGVFTGLAMGTYVFTVTDGNNCETTKSVTITEPSALSVSINSQTNVLCHGASTGAVTLLASGGNNSTYTYKKDASTSNTTGVFTGLAMGTYVFTVTDGNNCETTKSVSITEPTPLSISSTKVDVTINGGSNGKITVTGSGGTGALQFSKDNGANYAAGTSPFEFTNLSAGMFKIRVKDASGCESETKTVDILEPSSLNILSEVKDVTCHNGANGEIKLTISGGVAPYQFSKDDGANYSSETNPFTFTGLAAATYSIKIKDANGATASKSVIVNQPTVLNISVNSKQDKDCANTTGSVTLTVSGGTGALKVSLDGTNFQDGLTFNNLAAGDYTATVKDANNCTQTTTFKILNNGTPPTKPDAIADKTACNGETVKLTPNATGITSFKFYDKDPTLGGVTPLSTGADYSFVLTKNTEIWITSVTSLCESAPISTKITAVICEIVPKIEDPCTCKNNATTLTNGQFDEVVEVTAPSNQTWTVTAITGLFLPASAAPPAAPTPITLGTTMTYNATTNRFQLFGIHLDGVGYSVSVSNGLGVTLSIGNKCWYPEPMITAPLSMTACSSDALITLAGNAQLGDGTGAAMGTGSFTVDNVAATTINPATIGAGTYTIKYTFDATDNVPSAHPGCVQAISQTIEILSNPVVSSVVTPPSCVGSSDGAINITVVGTTAPYTFKWSNNATTEDLTGLSAGKYSVMVTDKNMCTAELKDIEVKTDNTLPTISSTASLLDNNTTGLCGKAITYNSSTTGIPAPAVTYELQGATIASGSGNGSGSFFNVGKTKVILTATNSCGTGTYTFDVTVNDTEKPVITCPSPITVNNDLGVCGAKVTFSNATATDNCAATVALTSLLASGSTFPVGESTVSFKATDAANNASTCNFKITVLDVESPVITCPSPITVNNDMGVCGAKVTFNNATATDNCGATVALTSLLASGSTFPVGESTVSFKATDAANNASTCNFKITVNDIEKPKITCPPSQTLTLGSFECSRVVVFADPSVSDNCSATFKRTDAFASYTSGTSFGAGIYPLSYRATDAANNTADCNFTIRVNGQLTSNSLKCLPTLTIALDERQCINIIDGPSLLIDNTYYCASYYNTRIPNRTDNYITSADLGKTLTVTVSDNFNNSCSTLVTVVDTKAPVTYAALDTIITCAELSRNGNILPNLSLPNIIYECSKTTFTYIDKILVAPNGQTFNSRPDGFPADKDFNLISAYNSAKIVIRTYTATDAFNNSSTVQRVIYVKNVELNQVECPKDVVVSCVQGNFNTSIASTGVPFVRNGASLQDASCAIDYLYFDEKTENTQGYILKRTWTLVNRNTQERKTCVQTITVNDTKPTITCAVNKTISIGSDKKAIILPTDLATASDNCTPQNALIWSITEVFNPNNSVVGSSNASLTYTCADLGTKTIQLSVKDAGGNSSNCTTTINIVDNNNQCINIPLLSLSGGINRESGENVTATVKLYNSTDSIGVVQASNYAFNNLLSGGSYRIFAARDNDLSNGVTTFDIALISKHILDLQPFTSPYQMIAADVNRDGEIDGSDMLLIRNLVLRRISRFPNNTAWRFLPKNYVFRDNKNPFADDFPEVLNFTNLTSSDNKADFMAVKVGDVNLSARAGLNALAVRNSKPTENVYFTDKKLEAGKEYVFDLNIKNPVLTALQLALKIDKNKVEYFKIGEGNLPQFEKGNFEVYEKEGVASVAWANPKKGILNSENSIIKIAIKARESAWLHDLLSLDAAFIDNFAYNTEGVEHNIELRFKANAVDKTEFELYQNFPNPFKEETVIAFTLPEEGSAELSIVDLSGREVFTTRRTFSKGYNEIRFNYEELKASGVYLYRLKTDKNVALKRMLYIKN